MGRAALRRWANKELWKRMQVSTKHGHGKPAPLALMMWSAAVLLLMTILPAQAQSTPPSSAPGAEAQEQTAPDAAAPQAAPETTAPDEDAPVKSLSEQEWRAIASGKTLYYYTQQGLVGREYYPPAADRRVVFVYFDGTCFDGTWSQEDGLYCYEFDGAHCFRHFQQGERLYVEGVDGDVQDILRITDEVLSCEPGLLSQAPSSAIATRLAQLSAD